MKKTDVPSDAVSEEAAAMDAEGNLRAAMAQTMMQDDTRSQIETFAQARREMGLGKQEEPADTAKRRELTGGERKTSP